MWRPESLPSRRKCSATRPGPRASTRNRRTGRRAFARAELGPKENRMSFDLVVRNGIVVDGSGRSRFRADVGVSGGRIASIGRIGEKGRREIDADGLVVAPGFIEVHSHMDAQVFWDPVGTSPAWHGITTTVMGNCGFTLAPCRESEMDLCLRNLERAEDMERATLLAGIKWGWETFAEYLDVVDRLPKGINYAGFLGHSALRTYVMG
ncbi:MAG: amidohydrolase family protein, partial [Betaproteobacteria bacterium]|nr:amidohydrolase family protein [Betaproteobacteria bacterium]